MIDGVCVREEFEGFCLQCCVCVCVQRETVDGASNCSDDVLDQVCSDF